MFILSLRNSVTPNSLHTDKNALDYYVKILQIYSFFWSVFSRIQSKYGKIRTRKNSVIGHFSHSGFHQRKNWFLMNYYCQYIIVWNPHTTQSLQSKCSHCAKFFHNNLCWNISILSVAIYPSFTHTTIMKNVQGNRIDGLNFY